MHVSKQQTEICIKPTTATATTSTNLKEQNKNENKKIQFGKIYDFFAMVLKNEAVNIHV